MSAAGSTRPGVRQWRHIQAALLLVILSGLLYARWLPNQFTYFLRDDSGLFLYAGQQLREGAALYTDVWDHKPPLIFWLNELGLWLGQGSPAGVVLLCFVFSLSFFVLSYAISAPALGALPALIGTLFSVQLLPELARTPNYTQSFALPLQALSLLLLLREWGGGDRAGYAVAQGAIGAFLFHLQANCVGVTLGYLLLSGFRQLGEKRVGQFLSKVSWLLLGFTGASAAILLPIVARGGLGEFWYGSIGFNLEYSGTTSLFTKLRSLYWGVMATSEFGAILLALPVVLSLAAGGLSVGTSAGRAVCAASLLFVVEALLSGVSGRVHRYYYLTWLLPISVLIGSFIYTCAGGAGNEDEQPSEATKRKKLIMACLATALTGLAVSKSIGRAQEAAATQERTGRMVGILREASRSSDRVQVWGSSYPEIHFRLRRRPASRLFQTAPLQHDRSLYRTLAPWLLSDLERNEPRFVIEMLAVARLPCLFAGEAARQHGWDCGPEDWDTGEMAARKAKLASRYEVFFIDSDVRTVVFQRKAS